MKKENNRYMNYIDAIDKFNEHHNKYKCYYMADNNQFRIEIRDKQEIITIKFRLILDEFKPIDEIIEVLEDLKKDLIKC